MIIDSFTGPYRFLSNFWPSPVAMGGTVVVGTLRRSFERRSYPTVEHAYQAAKSTDDAVRAELAALPSPGAAKRMGRTIDLRPDWEDIKLDVMRSLIAAKFQPGLELGNRLVSTAPATLVEGNSWNDRFWGVCRGQGENHLGLILMARRDELTRR